MEHNSSNTLFFYGNTQKQKDIIDRSCLSQWYSSPFFENDNLFRTAEHYMMYRKALVFGATDAAAKILASKNPKEVKRIGRYEILNFDQKVWEDVREEVVYDGNYLKFSQNTRLLEFLLNTENKYLVEASPYDKIWGIGLSITDPRTKYQGSWQGLNLLGKALMLVRSDLQK